MTSEEAIACIEAVLNSDYHYDESLGYQLTSDDLDWLDFAIQAIKERDSLLAHLRERAECMDCKHILNGYSDYCDSCIKSSNIRRPCWEWGGIQNDQ